MACIAAMRPMSEEDMLNQGLRHPDPSGAKMIPLIHFGIIHQDKPNDKQLAILLNNLIEKVPLDNGNRILLETSHRVLGYRASLTITAGMIYVNKTLRDMQSPLIIGRFDPVYEKDRIVAIEFYNNHMRTTSACIPDDIENVVQLVRDVFGISSSVMPMWYYDSDHHGAR